METIYANGDIHMTSSAKAGCNGGTIGGRKPALPPKPPPQRANSTRRPKTAALTSPDPTERSVKERTAFFESRVIEVAAQGSAITPPVQRKSHDPIADHYNGMTD